MSTLSEKIIAYRGKHRLTQDEFAEMCGVGRATIVNIEKGKAHPTRLTVAKIECVINEK